MDEQIPICNHHSGIISDIEQIKESDKKQWLAIEKLQARLPVWATTVISILSFLLGAALTYASLAGRAIA